MKGQGTIPQRFLMFQPKKGNIASHFFVFKTQGVPN